MDQFDELIKEKAEKKVFKYKPLFWILFAKSAGISAFSAVQIISTVVIIGGLAGYFILKKSNEQPELLEQVKENN